MDVVRLRALMKSRGLSQSELARRVGVSRQAVSLWLRQQPVANIQGRHLLAASRTLGVSMEELTEPLPCFEPDGEHRRLRAELLWDRLYPDLDDFAVAIHGGDPRAVARLVEVVGLYAAARIVGEEVWQVFPRVARYIHPARRKRLEVLHRWHETRTAA